MVSVCVGGKGCCGWVIIAVMSCGGYSGGGDGWCRSGGGDDDVMCHGDDVMGGDEGDYIPGSVTRN